MGHWEVGDLHWLCFSLINRQNLNSNFERNASDEKVAYSCFWTADLWVVVPALTVVLAVPVVPAVPVAPVALVAPAC